EPLSFDAFLKQPADYALKLLLDPRANASLSVLNRPAHGQQVLLLVGPEGGLSETEHDAANRAGFQGLRLGPRILRTETAALVALGLLQSRWGDLESD
ncbi:MAG: RsmE family RNA methyltransferase, partial [Gammaproteobacteria bacterium]